MAAILVNWFTMGLVLIILEMILPGIFLMWFGVSALIVGIITLIIPMAMNTELILFAVISVLSVLAVLYLMRKHVPESKTTVTAHLNQVRGAELIGQTFTLPNDCDGQGKLPIGDTVWLIRGPSAPANARIRITGIENNTLTYQIADDL
ncbi:NfeD family protein [Wohlfahrtiimonas chitiniclastica]|uniref:NfeD family protein n=1 Tax=Wohlfahrtiimonas chitiniclastica TaxID=400946 RepID=UPI001BCEFBC1|nr:NfeD family protein [Wohlfahrtiimonas chitiniclastica]